MHFTPLLGKKLKDDEVIEVLEWLDAQVIYDFDRTYENMPDKYWVRSQENGIQMGFDDQQRLEVIFLHIAPIAGFTPVDMEAADVTPWETLGAAETHAIGKQIPYTKGQGEFLGIPRTWIRWEFESHTVHYEYRQDQLAMMTLALRK